MKYQLTAFDRASERIRIPQIARDALHIQFANLASRTAQGAHSVAALCKNTGDMPAEEPASTGY